MSKYNALGESAKERIAYVAKQLDVLITGAEALDGTPEGDVASLALALAAHNKPFYLAELLAVAVFRAGGRLPA